MEEDWNISGSEDEGDVQFGGKSATKDNQGTFVSRAYSPSVLCDQSFPIRGNIMYIILCQISDRNADRKDC